MDKTKVVEKLNEILKWEYAGVVQYTQYGFLVKGPWRQVYEKFFRGNGEEALGHAQKIGEKIVTLGGVPTVERGEVKMTTDLDEMLQYSWEIENRHAALYVEALQLVGESDLALRILLEDIGTEEQEGAEHIEKLMASKDSALGVKAQAKTA